MINCYSTETCKQFTVFVEKEMIEHCVTEKSEQRKTWGEIISYVRTDWELFISKDNLITSNTHRKSCSVENVNRCILNIFWQIRQRRCYHGISWQKIKKMVLPSIALPSHISKFHTWPSIYLPSRYLAFSYLALPSIRRPLRPLYFQVLIAPMETKIKLFKS